MKKYISMIAMALTLAWGFTACDVETDEEPGGTNIQDMCGYWDVMWYAVDANGTVLDEWTDGTIYTYNKADNSTTQMWLDDQKSYWQFQFLVNIDYNAKTFSSGAVDYDAAGSGQAEVKNGKILLGAAKNLHGMPTDSIVFEISFTDDNYPAKYGFDHYRVEGTKHSGFTE
ncbi:MAG: hypothetical protein IKX65_09075 [Prevotella sp.]|nr:hypothetical protein [Prevotella sp.]